MNRQTHLLFVVAMLLLLSAGPLAGEEPAADVLIVDSFESGTSAPDEWKRGAAVPGVKYVYDRRVASDGKRSLSLQKSANRYFPIAGWSRLFKHKSDKSALKVTAKVKASKATKAVIDVLFLDKNEKWIKHKWVAYIGQKKPRDPVTTHDWKMYSGALEIPTGTRQIVIAFQIYGPGKVWFDELEARYVDSLAAAKGDDSQASSTRSKSRTSSASAVEIPSPIEIQMASGGVARYLLIPPSDSVARPKAGYPLLLVLPGGDGSADFHPFIRRVHEHALDGRFAVAQPLAPPQIVWPTGSSTARWGTTEESIAAIIDDVAKRHPIDPEHVHALAWSSSGPAVYATILQEQSPLARAFIAMSVFQPDQLPPLSHAAGRRIYLLHSPEDAVCPYRMAQDAEEQLRSAGADVTLVDYAGGHGWHGPVYDNIRAGMEWLQQTESR